MTSIKRLLASATIAGLLVLSACGGGGSSSGGGVTGADLVVKAREYSFDQQQYSAKPGLLKIGYENDGKLSHSLVIQGVGGFKILIAPGHSKTASVNLPSGAYKLYCDVQGHESLGMHASLVVQS